METRVRHNEILQTAATSGNGTAVDLGGLTRELTLSAGVTAGVVTFETARATDDTGTWDSLGTATFAADSTDTIRIAGCYAAVRSRISTAVVGGSVTCALWAN